MTLKNIFPAIVILLLCVWVGIATLTVYKSAKAFTEKATTSVYYAEHILTEHYQ